MLLANLLQLRDGPLALRESLLQADDLVLQTLVQSLLVFDRSRFDLQFLELFSRQELSNLALNENDLSERFEILSTLKPASDVGLDDHGFRVSEKLQVALSSEIAANSGLKQNRAILVAPSNEI